jgi:hypothetical protein
LLRGEEKIETSPRRHGGTEKRREEKRREEEGPRWRMGDRRRPFDDAKREFVRGA